MTKLAFITDTHAGIKSDASYMLDYQEKFYKHIFMPYLIKNGIDTVLHLGDLFDRRKYINYQTLSRTKEMFLDPLRDYNIKMHIIPGNHDVYHKNSNMVNSLKTLLKEYNNINIIETPKTLIFDNFKIMFIPWINPENEEECVSYMKENKLEVSLCCGHFEIAGFQMYRGLINDHGMSTALFKDFAQVFSGHFHLKSTDKNINYLGAPFEYTWADYNEEKGFHIYDTETQELEFIKNPYELYAKIPYDDTLIDYENIDYSGCEDKIIKLNVIKKTKPKVFDNFVDNLYKLNVIDLTIMELNDIVTTSEVDIKIENQSTKELIDAYIEDVETDLDKNKLKSLFSQLYIEAVHME